MGMFDEVLGHCPECGERVEFQSKAGECTLATFPVEEVPMEIAKDIQGDVECCQKCGYTCTIEVDNSIPSTVKMKIT